MDQEDGQGAGEGPLRRVAALIAAATVLLVAGPATARGPENSKSLVTDEQRRAVRDGIEWIAANQRSGGMWGDKDGTRVADTALSVLALMAGGNVVVAGRPLDFGAADTSRSGPVELRGPHAGKVKKGLEYLARLAWSAQDHGRTRGYIKDDKISKMHGHGFATLALAEAAGNLGAREVRSIRTELARGGGRDPASLSLPDQVRWALELAVRCIEGAQDRDTGGWWYEPYDQGHEGSMTVTMISALRAARDAGVSVSGATLRKAYDYVRTSQNLSNRDHYGGFAYQKTQKDRVSYALTAAALTTLFGLGRYGQDEGDDQIIEDGFAFLDRRFSEALTTHRWFYYSLFYGAQAVYQQHDSRRLRNHWPRIRTSVLAKQKADGSFTRLDRRSSEYCTAMGALILAVPMETLPIFQRR